MFFAIFIKIENKIAKNIAIRFHIRILYSLYVYSSTIVRRYLVLKKRIKYLRKFWKIRELFINNNDLINKRIIVIIIYSIFKLYIFLLS